MEVITLCQIHQIMNQQHRMDSICTQQTLLTYDTILENKQGMSGSGSLD